MTDLHCHILHDMDDGPAELGESLELCRIAWRNSIERIVATPHIADVGEIQEFLAARAARLEALKAALACDGIKVEVFAGAEVYITREMLNAESLNQLTINGSRYILVELPSVRLSPLLLREYMAEIKSRKLVPIIAHPERYVYRGRDDILNTLLGNDVLLQVNAGSLCRMGSKAEYRLAKDMIQSKVASFIATDAHSVLQRPNNLLEMLSALHADIDFNYLNALVNVNPENVLYDRTIDTYLRRAI